MCMYMNSYPKILFHALSNPCDNLMKWDLHSFLLVPGPLTHVVGGTTGAVAAQPDRPAIRGLVNFGCVFLVKRENVSVCLGQTRYIWKNIVFACGLRRSRAVLGGPGWARAGPCRAISCRVVPCRALLSCHAVPCRAMSCHAFVAPCICRAVPCHVRAVP